MNISWNNITGHKSNIERLTTLCREDMVPHSMLFCGIDGIGKKLAAQAMAATLLCHNPVEGAACGECPSCRALLAGTHPDFFTVEPERKKGNANIVIDSIREMQGKIARVPIMSKVQAVIIDDAQTMNEAAANSLLKTIEEPGGQVYFILVTNSLMALLDTIISRCMREEFAGLSSEDISTVLVQQGVAEYQANYLAAFADGSVRHAMLLNDEEGIALQKSAVEFFEACVNHGLDMEKVWSEGSRLGAMGKENKARLKQWFSFLSMVIRDQLVLYSGSEVSLYNQTDIARINQLAGQLSQNRLIAMLKLVREYQGRLRYNIVPQLMVESFIIKVKDLLED
ncbi:DNA polymerase III delta prime subunit [Anaerovibrio sp. JC8]|uniref:DNA polymerase III subunit delta' n=1 Tax=Anaerovibrio sp. JC8 TaxID=1240085 RepID=UPI000A0E8A6F|nr:DNA polymerase III subunit delta' [Anaerovibrio sp. JC8]ORU00893.1 DNA polymerase III delta prime subunit [Anaerovibrio sp. JC8]